MRAFLVVFGNRRVRRNIVRMLPIVLAIVCLGATAFAGDAPEIAAFPVQYSLDKRYLMDQNGTPFPIMGRTAWFITSLAVADYQTFIDDTAARGYDAIELHVVNHDPRGNNPPSTAMGMRLSSSDSMVAPGGARSLTETLTTKRRTSPPPMKLTGALSMGSSRIVNRRASWFSCSRHTWATKAATRAGCRRWWPMVRQRCNPTARGSQRATGTRKTSSG